MQSLTHALSTSKPEPSSLALPQRAIAEVFDSLNAQLGVKMADLYAGVPPKNVQAEWASRLAGFKRHELERGIDAASNRKFAPTIGEFKQLCRPCLDHETAWLEAEEGMRERAQGRMGYWTHPAVYRAGRELAHELRTRTFAECRRRWEHTLSRELRAGWGEPVPEPLPRLTDDTTVGPPPDFVRRRMAEILTIAKRTPTA